MSRRVEIDTVCRSEPRVPPLPKWPGQIDERLQQYGNISRQLDRIITSEQEARSAMQSTTHAVEERELEPVRIAGVRMQGQYSDCGGGFSRIGRRFGRHICGKPLLLHYDSEYRADDADFEACMPISRGESREGIDVRELPGGRCVLLLHSGPRSSPKQGGRGSTPAFKRPTVLTCQHQDQLPNCQKPPARSHVTWA